MYILLQVKFQPFLITMYSISKNIPLNCVEKLHCTRSTKTVWIYCWNNNEVLKTCYGYLKVTYTLYNLLHQLAMPVGVCAQRETLEAGSGWCSDREDATPVFGFLFLILVILIVLTFIIVFIFLLLLHCKFPRVIWARWQDGI